MNFAEQISTHRFWKTHVSKGDSSRWWGDVLGLWDGNPIKLDCDDHYLNVINSLSNKKKDMVQLNSIHPYKRMK